MASSASISNPSSHQDQWSELERLSKFGQAIEAIQHRAEAELGVIDLNHIRSIKQLSRWLEITGRSFIHISLDPITFSTGVVALWLHKQLETAEIGHTVLHGAYDKLTKDKDLRSSTFKWDFPVDENSWRLGHNSRHHPFTNIADQDPDIHFGILRLTSQTPHRFYHYFQLPITLLIIVPNFGAAMNTHFTGLLDFYLGNGRTQRFDFLRDRSFKSVLSAHNKALRKYIPYYVKNYLFYPLLAGPLFPKVLFGNWLAETIRDVYTAATVFCGHVGADVKTYSSGTKARNKGEWYAMQIESSNNYKVPLPFSILCGGLDHQIEHHLFPKLPPNRLREISGIVRSECEQYGISYHCDSWGKTLGKVVKQIMKLSKKNDSIG